MRIPLVLAVLVSVLITSCSREEPESASPNPSETASESEVGSRAASDGGPSERPVDSGAEPSIAAKTEGPSSEASERTIEVIVEPAEIGTIIVVADTRGDESPRTFPGPRARVDAQPERAYRVHAFTDESISSTAIALAGEPVTLELRPRPRLSGTVTGGGEPVEAELQLGAWAADFESRWQTVTNSGRFAIEGLEPGFYALRVKSLDDRFGSRLVPVDLVSGKLADVRIDLDPTPSPGSQTRPHWEATVVDRDTGEPIAGAKAESGPIGEVVTTDDGGRLRLLQARTVTVRRAGYCTATFARSRGKRLELVSGRRVAGRVVDESGKPIRAATISVGASVRLGQFLDTVSANENGDFEVWLAAEATRMWLTIADDRHIPRFIEVTEISEEALQIGTVQLAAGATAILELQSRSSKRPIANTEILSRLIEVPDSRVGTAFERRGTTTARGRVVIHGLAPGEYRVGSGENVVFTVGIGESFLRRADLLSADETALTDIRITADGVPVEGARVEGSQLGTVYTSPEGVARVHGHPPLRLRVTPTTDLLPELMTYDRQIYQGQSIPRRVELHRRAEVRGQVLFEGKPAAGFRIEASTDGYRARLTADGEGRFRLDVPSKGPWKLVAQRLEDGAGERIEVPSLEDVPESWVLHATPKRGSWWRRIVDDPIDALPVLRADFIHPLRKSVLSTCAPAVGIDRVAYSNSREIVVQSFDSAETLGRTTCELPVLQMSYGAEGSRLIVMTPHDVLALDAQSLEEVWHLPRIAPRSIDLTPDGRTIAISSQRAVRIIEVETGRERSSVEAGSYAVWSADGKSLFARNGGKVECYPGQGGEVNWEEPTTALDQGRSSWNAPMFRAPGFGGVLILTLDGLYHLPGGKAKANLVFELPGEWSSDWGGVCRTEHGFLLRITQVPPSGRPTPKDFQPVMVVEFTGGRKLEHRVWAERNLARISLVSDPSGKRVFGFVPHRFFQFDRSFWGKDCEVADWGLLEPDGRVWTTRARLDVQSGRTAVLEDQGGEVVKSSTHWIARPNRDQPVMIERASGRERPIVGPPEELLNTSRIWLSDGGTYLATIEQGEEVWPVLSLWNLETGHRLYEILLEQGPMQLSPDGVSRSGYVVGSRKDAVVGLDQSGNEAWSVVNHGTKRTTVAGERVATANRLLDAKTGAEILKVSKEGRSELVDNLLGLYGRFGDPRLDGRLRLVDAETGQYLVLIDLPRELSDVRFCGITPDRTRLLVIAQVEGRQEPGQFLLTLEPQ